MLSKEGAASLFCISISDGVLQVRCKCINLKSSFRRHIDKFYILLTVELKKKIKDQRDAQIIFYVFVSIYNSPHVSSISCSSSGETFVSPDDEHDVLETCINTASGNCHSMLVAEMCAGYKKVLLLTSTRHGHQHRMTVTRGCIDTICLP